MLNLAPTMARQAEERQVYFHAYHDSLGIGHWSEAGHQAAGELMALWLAGQLTDSTTSGPNPTLVTQ